MLQEIIGSLAESRAVVDFTDLQIQSENYFSFDWFDSKVIECLDRIKESGQQEIVIIDYAVGLSAASPSESIKLVTDHINLTTLNPLLGPNDEAKGPRFFPVNDLYLQPNELKSKIGASVVAGLNSMAEPTEKEKQILIESGATDYAYDFVLSSLVAAHRGLKVVGILISGS